jgi:hypothetical protein
MSRHSIRRLSLPFSLMSTLVAMLVASGVIAGESIMLPDFSATEVTQLKGSEITSKVYRSGGDFRTDPSPETGTIYIADTQTMYRLMFGGKQCIETTGISPHALSSPLQLLSGAVVTDQSSGTVVVEGHPCKILDAQIATAKDEKIRFKIWEAQDLKGVPVKIEMHTERGQLTTTYRDIVVGKQDSALFAPPTNCKPFAKTYQVAQP